jgi:muramoyltetrapeptide carboxypeptidase
LIKIQKEALELLFNALIGKWKIEMNETFLRSFDDIKIVGGNLSVLYSLFGSDLFPETDGKILFIEKINEYLYHIELMGLKREGKLVNLKALLVGTFINMCDSADL